MSIGNPNDPKQQAVSLVFGVRHTFTIEVVVLAAAVVLSLFLKRNNLTPEKN